MAMAYLVYSAHLKALECSTNLGPMVYALGATHDGPSLEGLDSAHVWVDVSPAEGQWTTIQ